MAKNPKNIVMIITDQQRAPDAFGEENRAKMNLPAMDRLAAHGMTFTHAVCNSCMCSPSRTTMFTGRYPAQHGVTQTLSYGGKFSVGQVALDPTLPNLGNIFARSGYDTQYRGKWHLSKSPVEPENPESLSHSDVALFGFKGWVAPDAGEDAEPVHFGGGWPNMDAQYVQQARDYIKTHNESDDDTPFVLVLSLVNPHDCLAYPNSWDFGYSPSDFERTPETRLSLPPSWNEDLGANQKPAAQAQLKVVMARSLGALNGDVEKANYLNFYATLCEKVDAEINDFLDLFYEADGETPNALFEDTMIVRIADHGEMGMAHGGLRQKAFNVYEETMRVPMIWSNPVMFPVAQSSDALASLIDILPTAISLTGANGLSEEDQKALAGTDLTPILQGQQADVQDAVLFTFDDIRASSSTMQNVVAAPNRIRCVRTKEAKYAEYFQADSKYAPQYELYDLTAPTTGNADGENGLEYDNLFYGCDGQMTRNPSDVKLIEEMRDLLAKQMAEKVEVDTQPMP